MPAQSESQKHYMQMALAVKHGHTIKGMSPAMNKKLHKTAESMSDEQLRGFATMAKGKKGVKKAPA
jgi:hypothetical protein